MIAKLYNVTDDNRVVDKHLADGHYIADVDILLKDVTNVSDPSITLAGNFKNVNYIYIPEFKRYYFVTVSSVNQGVWSMECHVDVLMSFKNEFRKSRCIVNRSAKKGLYNLYLNDSEVKVYQNSCPITVPFNSGFNHLSYTLMTVGG